MYAIQIDGETVGDQLHERGEETSIRIATPAEEGIGALIECPCGWEGDREELSWGVFSDDDEREATLDTEDEAEADADRLNDGLEEPIADTRPICPECDEVVEIPDPDPADWLNSARITISPDENAVHCVVSVGDPRGGFAFTVRQLDNGRLVMHTPYPGQSFAHAPLTPVHSGTYGIGNDWRGEAAARFKTLRERSEALREAIARTDDMKDQGPVTALRGLLDELVREEQAVAAG